MSRHVPWTPEETLRLRRLRDEGLSHSAIAERLGRTARAIQHRIDLMDAHGWESEITSRHHFAWTPERINALTSLWSEKGENGRPKYSARQIGLKIGTTACSVIGKVHRLGLPERASPINRSATRPPRRPSEATVPSLPAPTAEVIRMPHVEKLPETSFAPAPMRNPLDRGESAKACQWIAGQPSADDSCKCDKPTVPGRSWCEEHMQRVVLVRTVSGGTRPWRPEDEARLRRKEAAA